MSTTASSVPAAAQARRFMLIALALAVLAMPSAVTQAAAAGASVTRPVVIPAISPAGRALPAAAPAPVGGDVAAGGRAGASFADADDPDLVMRGRALYAQHCAACHGAQLQGQPNWQSPRPGLPLPAPPHDPSGHTWQHSDRELLAVLERGVPGLAPPGQPPDMPSFASMLQEDAMLAVLAFIKSTWPPYIRAAQALLNPNARGFPDLPADADWTLPGACPPGEPDGATASSRAPADAGSPPGGIARPLGRTSDTSTVR